MFILLKELFSLACMKGLANVARARTPKAGLALTTAEIPKLPTSLENSAVSALFHLRARATVAIEVPNTYTPLTWSRSWNQGLGMWKVLLR